MSLAADFQAAFCAGLASGRPPADIAGPPEEAARRFAVYRNNVRVGLSSALERRFPVIVRLVGEDFARAMFAAFQDAHPPRSPLMMRYGEELPGFIEGFPPAASLPYLPDIARLELARGRAYHAADAPPLAAEALAAAAARDPEDLRLGLHPSVEIVASPHPVHVIWALNQPGAERRPIGDWRAESVLVARSGVALLTLALPPGEAAFLAALLAGETLAAAAEAAWRIEEDFDPAPALARLFRAGLVTALM